MQSADERWTGPLPFEVGIDLAMEGDMARKGGSESVLGLEGEKDEWRLGL